MQMEFGKSILILHNNATQSGCRRQTYTQHLQQQMLISWTTVYTCARADGWMYNNQTQFLTFTKYISKEQKCSGGDCLFSTMANFSPINVTKPWARAPLVLWNRVDPLTLASSGTGILTRISPWKLVRTSHPKQYILSKVDGQFQLICKLGLQDDYFDRDYSVIKKKIKAN